MKNQTENETKTDGCGSLPLATGPASSKAEQALKMRITALYHNCMSSAAFKREDALKEDDENVVITLRREACAYDQCAGWLSHVIK